MSLDLQQYKTLVFDCDGVVLDSNQLKTEAYYHVAMGFGANHEQAQALVDYHVRLGGISRFIKFRYFLDEILHQPVTDDAMAELLESFAEEIHRGLLVCEMAAGLIELREITRDTSWMLVSGGDQTELRTLFAERGIDELFDAGIFGSPDNKDVILEREGANGNLPKPAIFFGDSRYDHEAAIRAGLDFVFVSRWTELQDWQAYCSQHKITVIERLSDAYSP
ncbi:MAG TPA: HAD family hydrolase [Methylophilaceae bacterium]|nr:HAD family hydrolase [Methylophilaceae bacterium]HZV62052.1 HAD family hydrolase [Methylophilaceae bacterium]